jgi:hypothetical protein
MTAREPCPFCCHHETIVLDTWSEFGRIYWIGCKSETDDTGNRIGGCGAQGPSHIGEAKAVAAWNRRAKG